MRDLLHTEGPEAQLRPRARSLSQVEALCRRLVRKCGWWMASSSSTPTPVWSGAIHVVLMGKNIVVGELCSAVSSSVDRTSRDINDQFRRVQVCCLH